MNQTETVPVRHRGARTKLTPGVIKRVIQVMSTGTSHKSAAAVCGIVYATARLWRTRGRKEFEAAEGQSPFSLYVQYYLGTEMAYEAAQAAREKRIFKAGTHDWRADAWALEQTRGTRDRARMQRLKEQTEQARAQVLAEQAERLRLANEQTRLINQRLQEQGPSVETMRLFQQEVLRLQELDDQRQAVLSAHPVPSWDDDDALEPSLPTASAKASSSQEDAIVSNRANHA